MKRFIPLLSSIFLLAACSTNPKTETKALPSASQTTLPVDTAGLAQFQQWKAQSELTVAEPPRAETAPLAPAPTTKTVTVVREVLVEKPTPVRKRTVAQKPTQPVPAAPSETTAGDSPAATGTDAPQGNTAGTGGAEVPAPSTAKKEGWSKSTKGAVIGSAGGAVIGAVINKRNRAAGAVIGGVLGGAVGYGMGKKKDNRDSTRH